MVNEEKPTNRLVQVLKDMKPEGDFVAISVDAGSIIQRSQYIDDLKLEQYISHNSTRYKLVDKLRLSGIAVLSNRLVVIDLTRFNMKIDS